MNTAPTEQMPIGALVSELKANGEDHEFYPTTDEIIGRMMQDLKRIDRANYSHGFTSVLDIGAGNGKVLQAFKDKGDVSSLYAIEKSMTLCAKLADLAYIIGTDFRYQSLLAKEIDLTFCNPPYSEFEDWATKIIRESASKVVYLVLPVRWVDSLSIAAAIQYREAKQKILGEYSFEDSEDRQARATVNLIRIELSTEKDDAFDRFFDEQFAHLKARYEATEPQKDGNGYEQKRNPKFTALVGGQNQLEALVALYDADMEHTRKNYALAAQLDVDLLRELHVTPKSILECLKQRITGLRTEYWHELFGHLSAVTNRLCHKQRERMLGTLNENGHVDFTVDNAYAVLLWVLKHANDYIDEQLVQTFEKMVSKANVHNYKSNLRPFVYDDWRYSQNTNADKPTHIALEYRIVLHHSGGIENRWGTQELSETAAHFIGDLLTVAHNLGFPLSTSRNILWDRRGWPRGSAVSFYGEVDGKEEVILEVRAFLNWNMHIRMNQKFALALNVEHGRLKGWIKTPKDAAEELNDPKAAACFNTCFRLGASSVPLLAGRVA